MKARIRTMLVLTLVLSTTACEDRLAVAAYEETLEWEIGEVSGVDARTMRLEFSHPRFGSGTAYVSWLEGVSEVEARKLFFYWAQCFVGGAALDVELRDSGWGIEDRWMVEDYCETQRRQVRVEWHTS